MCVSVCTEFWGHRVKWKVMLSYLFSLEISVYSKRSTQSVRLPSFVIEKLQNACILKQVAFRQSNWLPSPHYHGEYECTEIHEIHTYLHINTHTRGTLKSSPFSFHWTGNFRVLIEIIRRLKWIPKMLIYPKTTQYSLLVTLYTHSINIYSILLSSSNFVFINILIIFI